MELLELFYVALGTIGILIALHLGTFAIARIMTPAKPKIVYVQAPAPPPAPPPAPAVAVPPPVLSQAPPTIQLPTYDTPPDLGRGAEASPAAAPRGLPPPIETRSATKQSGGDMGPPR
jgi:hypothetical protein